MSKRLLFGPAENKAKVQELFDAALGFSSKLKQHVGQSNKKTL